ncbi:MAG: hypothetical protein ACOC53_00215 [Candidatus Saliniplasma sp.]
MKEKEDRAPVKVIRVIALILPLFLKLLLVYLKYKRKVKRKEKYLRRELEKAGMKEDHIRELCSEIQVLSLRDLLSSIGLGDHFTEIIR